MCLWISAIYFECACNIPDLGKALSAPSPQVLWYCRKSQYLPLPRRRSRTEGISDWLVPRQEGQQLTMQLLVTGLSLLLFVCFCLFAFVCLLLFVCFCLFAFVCLLLFAFVCLLLFVCVCLFAFVCLLLFVCFCLFAFVCFCVFVCLFVYVQPACCHGNNHYM